MKKTDKTELDNEGFGSIPSDKGLVTAQSHAVTAYAGGGRGFEEPVDNEDLIIPRAKLLQPTAEELTQTDNNFRSGQIINSLTKEQLGDVFTPLMFWKEYMRFNGRKVGAPGYDASFEPGKLMWRTRDANDPRVLSECQFGENGETPVAITQLNFMCLFDGQDMPVILSFSKTSYKAGKNLLSLAKFRGGDMFSNKYKLSTISVKGDEGNYYVLKVDPAGKCEGETYKKAEEYFKNFSPKRDRIQTHEGEVA